MAGKPSSGLLLHRGGVSRALAVFAFHLHALVGHPSFLATLVHVVGPLGAGPAAAPSACPLAVYEAPPAGGEGSTASAAVVHPGFLPVSIIVLVNERDVGAVVLQSVEANRPHRL